jgi:hypothetical protein
MATGVPAIQQLEIEFTAGVWTDVTADWDAPGGPLTIHMGRADRYSQPSPGSMTFTLDNHLGKYTPQRQVLADGVTAHPYWPNVVPRKRVRYSYTISAVKYVLFLGSIKGWPPALENGVRPVVTITATDRMDQLARVKMKSPLRQEMLADSPDLLWPLDDASGATQAQTAPVVNSAAVLGVAGSGPALTFGDNGPGVGDGSGVKFSPASATSGQILMGRPFTGLNLAAYTIECFVNLGTSLPAWAIGSAEHILGLTASGTVLLGVFYVGVNTGVDGCPYFNDDSGMVKNSSTPIVDGAWHHLAATRTAAGGNVTFYVDGVAASGGGASSGSATVADTLTVGDASTASLANARFQGNVGYVAIYDTALSAARIAAHAVPRNGFSGDTTDARIARYLSFAGLTATDWALDVGQTTVGTYPQAGKDVVSACQDMATTEGGGAVIWVRPSDGNIRFPNRRYRDTTTPALTLDASVDLDASIYDPAFDETTLVNTSTVSRSAESGTLSTQTYTDTVSAAQPPTGFGPSNADITTYTQSDQDALNLAQAQVAGNAYPAFRLNQIAVNLHASVNNLYVAVASVEIGSRIRVANLPPGAAPTGTIDLFLEGWTVTVTEGTFRFVADTSAADSPPRGKWGTFRWGCAGQTLSTTLASAATTTVVLATAGTGNPTFTTAAVYPEDIQIGAEQIRLNSAPGGATSPQTFTGCTRGVNGTTAPPSQASGSTVTLAPATAWAL